jgi:hypothetical protein
MLDNLFILDAVMAWMLFFYVFVAMASFQRSLRKEVETKLVYVVPTILMVFVRGVPQACRRSQMHARVAIILFLVSLLLGYNIGSMRWG